MKTQLQAIRRAAGYKSARAFAEAIGMSVNTYTAFEQGRHSMSLAQATEFCEYLGEAMGRRVTLDELAGRWKYVSEEAILQIREYLSPDERELVDTYRDANAQGRAAIDAVARASRGVAARGVGEPEPARGKAV